MVSPTSGPPADADDGDRWDPLGVARIRVQTIWLVLALLAVLAIGAVYGHRLVEDDIDRRATRVLDQAGFDDVEVVLVGRHLTLTGTVPGEEDVERAAETLRSVAGIKGITIELETGGSSP